MSQIANNTDILDVLSDVARGAAQGRGLRVKIKTNFGPAVTVYDYDDPSRDGPAFVKAGIIVTDRFDNTMTTYGTIPRTDYILLGSVAAAAVMITVLVIRGIRK